MKIIEWNIKHGGSERRIPGILSAIRSHDADIVVLTEYRIERKEQLMDGLQDMGYVYILTSDPMPRTNGILIASRSTLKPLSSPYAEEGVRQRWLEVEIVERGLRLLCLHIPGAGDSWGKEAFWRSVIEYARDHADDQALMIGDFNTGLEIDAQGTPFKFSNYMSDLLELGWVDVWRDMNNEKREYSWFSNAGNGFRLDYLYATKSVRDDVNEVELSHSEREGGISDHSLLIAKIS